MAQNLIVDARGLHAWYGSSHVLHGVDQRDGHIKLFGQDASRFKPHEVARLGLMTHPVLIVLDEATEGLAPLIVAEIWRVIGEIRASGIATLIVDRDYRKVLARSDHALVLQKGQVALHGTAEEVASDPALAAYLGV